MKILASELQLKRFSLGRPAGLRRPAGTFTWDFPLGNFRLRSSALKISIGNFRLGSFDWELSLDSFRLGSFVWQLSLWIFRFGTFALELALRNFRLETLACKLSFLGTVASELSLQSFAEDLSLAIIRDLSLGNAQQACAGRLGFST